MKEYLRQSEKRAHDDEAARRKAEAEKAEAEEHH
jgi:hypothetical protein